MARVTRGVAEQGEEEGDERGFGRTKKRGRFTHDLVLPSPWAVREDSTARMTMIRPGSATGMDHLLPQTSCKLMQFSSFFSMFFTMYRILVEEVWVLIIAPTGPRGDVWLSEATLRILHWQVSTCVYFNYIAVWQRFK